VFKASFGSSDACCHSNISAPLLHTVRYFKIEKQASN